ncbi:hypothetical protein OW763_13710 [Clostridium aestuarii]|uniref:Uncharacterized protein n=1 Tax=Clostridium aestuarii TaxID=338193 RepID=A0ABT4D2A9_9CLOT|nr:hypothetical protein [Clostridium aestuarii]MCY6485388.1 hypothetical protein [Clostridium aestuarii]
MNTIFFNNKGIKKDKNSLHCSEICDSEEEIDKQNADYFDGDIEVLIGEDIDLKNTKVEKVFNVS